MRILSLLLAALASISIFSPVVAQAARPVEYKADFHESDFQAKPWMTEFEWVAVVDRANTGTDRQSIRVYHNQKIVTYVEIATYLNQLTATEVANNVADVNLADRDARVAELAKKQWAPGVFKVSTGRNAFESKGQHHSQHASWTVTPTGYFTPQAFAPKHKSESYSSSLCETLLGGVIDSVTSKSVCTYMENVTFFNGPIGLHKAIPGTEGMLGEKASGGCVRLPAALAEYLFHNFQESALIKPVPAVNPDGTVAIDSTGVAVHTTTNVSIWGKIQTRSVLIIVKDSSQL